MLQKQIMNNDLNQLGCFLDLLPLKKRLTIPNKVLINEKLMHLFVVPQVPQHLLDHTLAITSELQLWSLLQNPNSRLAYNQTLSDCSLQLLCVT